MPEPTKAERIRRQGGRPQATDYTDAELAAMEKKLRADLEKIEAERARRRDAH